MFALRNLRFERGSTVLFWRIVLGSLAFHLLLLGMPWPDRSLPPAISQAAHELENESPAIALSDFAIVPLPPQKPALQPAPQSAIQSGLQSGFQSSPQPNPQPAEPQPNPTRSIQAAPQPALTNSTADSPLSDVSDPLPANSPANSPAELPANDSAGDLGPEDGPANEPANDMVGDRFPHLAQAQAGCYGLESCHRLSDGSSYHNAAKQLKNQMKAAGYQVHERDDLADSGHRVFEVISPDQPDSIYYLNVFSDSLGSTVYVLSAEVLSLDRLQQLSS